MKIKLFPFELFRHYNIKSYRKVAHAIYELAKN